MPENPTKPPIGGKTASKPVKTAKVKENGKNKPKH